MALQKINFDGPEPYYKKKGFIGPILPDNLEYLENQPFIAEPIPVARPSISSTTTLMSNRTPRVSNTELVTKKVKGEKFQKVLSKANEAGKSILPYASNIVNAFRTPPKVPMPNLDPLVTLQKVNYDNDRYEVEKGIRGANLNAYRNLDENTATAITGYNLAQRFNQLSAVNQAERNQNLEISNKEVLTNAGIKSSNNAKLDKMAESNVERRLAMQRESAENIANAVDKKIMIDNEKSKANLDLKKFAILARAYNREGVAGREIAGLNEIMNDPLGAEFYNNKAGKTQVDIGKKVQEEYKKREAERKKKWKEDNNDFLITKKKQSGGSIKYSTGGMMRVFGSGGIMIKPENKGKFTAWAKAHDMGVQEAASHVMANKDDYSSTIVKRANFAKNFGGRK